jgi:hypothetical protein
MHERDGKSPQETSMPHPRRQLILAVSAALLTGWAQAETYTSLSLTPSD